MAKVSVSSEVAAAPDKVWQLVLDLPRFAEWNTMHDAFVGDIPSTLDAGSTYKQRVKLMGMPAEVAWRVTGLDAPNTLDLAGDGPMGVKAKNHFQVEPAGEGSRITFEMEFAGPALTGPMAAMVEKQAGTGARASLDKFVGLLA
jgi:carbon monoxide dehydrogenase subunit G